MNDTRRTRLNATLRLFTEEHFRVRCLEPASRDISLLEDRPGQIGQARALTPVAVEVVRIEPFTLPDAGLLYEWLLRPSYPAN